MEQHDYIFKIILVGDTAVGKSNLKLRFAKGSFDYDTKSTIGVEFASKTICVDKKVINAQIWDTAGQERYRSLTTSYFRGCQGAIIVYDITERSTFESVEQWLSQLRLFAKDDTVIMLVGNKSDLKEQRVISIEEAMEFAERNNIAFQETSALDNLGVNEAFEQILIEIYKQMKKGSISGRSPGSDPSKGVPLTIQNTSNKSRRTPSATRSNSSSRCCSSS